MLRQIRKITKSTGDFTSDQALLKLIYLVIQDITKKNGQCIFIIGDRIKAFSGSI